MGTNLLLLNKRQLATNGFDLTNPCPWRTKGLGGLAGCWTIVQYLSRAEGEYPFVVGSGRFVLMCLVVLLSVTGSSARDTFSSSHAVRVPPAEKTSVDGSQKRDLARPLPQADIRERQMLAWIILLMKDGRAAR